ncbi:MAG: hypothetical protein HYR73_03510 [Candidatus Eisenbacteria bacterium]|nr:hypothetical protein [Candidatus Eisenbacteria bacterium]
MFTRSLTRALIEAHRVDVSSGELAAGYEPIELRPDHVLAGGVAAVVALAAFEGLGSARLMPDLALVGAERHGAEAAFEGGDELRDLHEASMRVGAYFVRPGDGRCEQAHFERFAAPGRLLCSAGRRAPIAGALGMLVLPCGALEAAAALGGGAVDCRESGALGVELRGTLPANVDGHDVACAMIEKLGDGGARGRWIEFGGVGVASIGMMSRIAMARAAERLGSPAALFPSDAVTRAFLSAQQRDADWRKFETGAWEGSERALTLTLDTLEPMTLPIEGGDPPRPVREDRGARIEAVVIGAGAGAADLARLARALAGRSVHPGVALRIVTGSRQVRSTAEAAGVLAALREAGAEIIEGTLAPLAAPLGLAYGTSAGDLMGGRTSWRRAGLATCAAAALCGALEDPRDAALEGAAEQAIAEFEARDTVRVASASEIREHVPARAFPFGRAFDGPLRGPVLGRFGDGVSTEQVLPWGARVRSMVGDFDALSAHAFGRLDPEFAARARAARGGFVAAGDQFGGGEPWDTAALALVRLGVRGILARSIVPSFARLLAVAGVLPLEWANAADADAVSAGDELELPGLPETFVAGRPLVARNLTRGTQYTLRHALGPRDVERLRHGGWLANMDRAHSPRP